MEEQYTQVRLTEKHEWANETIKQTIKRNQIAVALDPLTQTPLIIKVFGQDGEFAVLAEGGRTVLSKGNDSKAVINNNKLLSIKLLTHTVLLSLNDSKAVINKLSTHILLRSVDHCVACTVLYCTVLYCTVRYPIRKLTLSETSYVYESNAQLSKQTMTIFRQSTHRADIRYWCTIELCVLECNVIHS